MSTEQEINLVCEPTNINVPQLLSYLFKTGWVESDTYPNHYTKGGTRGLVAIENTTGQAFIVEFVGDVPWSKIQSFEQFERDVSHLQ
ncbi:hypothetical protein [Vibrio penaeicida]|uniref:Uncharacterized protein n=1 Tax=Vibrio penaeicida TaxID=104609 RepID=A0AAV5NK41_9VIBR|nr:hypothetical protein [Vibrio penaeicida]GLQ70974.1 hypothetical protein GCM10007932_03340 [Vibrio penaeicida]